MLSENEDRAQQQAQQQFQNKQVADRAAREADEQTLAHARDAREQQDDIRKALQFNMNMQREAFGLAHDQIQQSMGIANHLTEQTIKMETDQQLGVQRAKIDTMETPIFTGDDAQAKMQDYVVKNIAALTQKGFVVSPRWGLDANGKLSGYLVEEPRPVGPIPVGFKLDKEGQPLLDGNGNRIPDGTIKGPELFRRMAFTPFRRVRQSFPHQPRTATRVMKPLTFAISAKWAWSSLRKNRNMVKRLISPTPMSRQEHHQSANGSRQPLMSIMVGTTSLRVVSSRKKVSSGTTPRLRENRISVSTAEKLPAAQPTCIPIHPRPSAARSTWPIAGKTRTSFARTHRGRRCGKRSGNNSQRRGFRPLHGIHALGSGRS